MAQSEAEWLEQHAQRLLTGQKNETDAAKLLATFVAAVAATLVGTALQVGAPTALDVCAVVALGLSLLATVGVIVLDRLRAPDHAKILTEKLVRSWDGPTTLAEFRIEELAAVAYNTAVVRRVKIAVTVQTVLAFAAGALAAVSLLVPGVG